MFQLLGITAGVLAIISHIPYLLDTLKGKTRPERASWLIWSVLGIIAFFSQLSKGATDSLWLNGLDTGGSLIIFLLSIKFGMGGLEKRDILSLIFAAVGLFLWFLTHEPLIALIIVILVDFLGSILTITKAYHDPETETLTTYAVLVVSASLAIVSVGKPNLILLLYPLYLGVVNGATALAILLGRREQKNRTLRAI